VRYGAEGTGCGAESGDHVFDYLVRRLDPADRSMRCDCNGPDGAEYLGIAETVRALPSRDRKGVGLAPLAAKSLADGPGLFLCLEE
jgi:hypothetical protein